MDKKEKEIPERLLQLVVRWREQSKIVGEDLEDYAGGYYIKKSKISKDVSDMKLTFKQIEAYIKEL